MAKNTYGTGCFLLMNTGDAAGRLAQPAAHHRRVAARRATRYALEGSVFIAGAAIQWLRDGLGIIAQAAEIEALAASVPDTGGVFFVPALSGLGAPVLGSARARRDRRASRAAPRARTSRARRSRRSRSRAPS